MNIQPLWPALALGLLAASASAGAQQALTWDQVKAKFEASNPALKADADNVDEMKAEEITAFLRPNPQFTLLADGTQIAPLNYPHLRHTEIFESVEDFYKKFYFRPSKIAEILKEMLTSRDMLVRRLREGVEFFQFLKNREDMIVS